MKLLIADDEPKIRNGLCHFFQNSDIGFDAIETAQNGEDALKKALDLIPDILLVDICMPKMNGFEFLTELRHKLRDTKIVIISGHDDFSFAQKAIKIGARDYILKPIDLLKLEPLIKKLCREVTYERNRYRQTSLLKDTIKQNRKALINSLFQKILGGHIAEDDARRELSLLGVVLPDPAGLLVIRVVERLAENTSEWELPLLCCAIDNMTNDLCEHLHQRICFSDNNQNLMLLFAYVPDIDYTALQNRLCDSVQRHIGYVIATGMTVISNPCLHLRGQYRQLVAELVNAKAYSQIVLQAKNCIEKLYNREDTTLQMVAEALQVNPSYLSRLMHKQLGMGFVEFLTSYRMKRAAFMLRYCEKDMRMYEIAQQLGYSSQHYFCRLFKRWYGVSPMQFRAGDIPIEEGVISIG